MIKSLFNGARKREKKYIAFNIIMEIKTHKQARAKLTEQEQADIVNWYADTFNYIEDIPIKEINYYLRELK